MTYIRDARTGRFLVGNNGAAGHPKGARNKLAEAFIDDIYQDWKQHGIQVIQEVRETMPSDYLKICAILVRSSSEFNSISETMHSDAIAELIEERRILAQPMIAKMRESQ
jgi:hypothetical protein